MKTIDYKMKYSILEFIFGLIGPTIITASIFYPIPDLKIGTQWFHLPPGVANSILAILGIYITYLTGRTLFEKRAVNSQGAKIFLGEEKITFTNSQKYRGVLTTVSYDAIDNIVITDIPETTTSCAEKVVKINTPAPKSKKYEFDAIHMAQSSDFYVLVDALKLRAINATFEKK